MHLRKLAVLGVVLFGFGCAQRPDEDGSIDESQSVTLRGPSVALAQQHDASPPLYLMQPAERQQRIDREPKPVPRGPAGNFVAAPRVTVQTTIPSLAMPAAIANFEGVGDGLSGPQGTFAVNSAPPDTNGDIGPNHYVQTVNTDFAVFSKTGQVLYGPVPINTLWSGFGGGCQTNNDGDPVVLYDGIADRWIITQFSVSSTPYLECVAVSQTPDPTGAYYRYAFNYGNSDFPDYPKLGVWPDAYYATFNIFAGGSTFSGAKACAYDRSKMLTGAAATMQCFSTSNAWGGLLPADLDGARLPPAGSPNYMVALGTNSLGVWKFHTDWTTPSNSTFSGPTSVAVASYSEACSGGTCIKQAGTTQTLDSLADRLMFRLAYRNFGDHESMVVNHSVTAGSSTGVRWYELRVASGAVSVFQQGTYAPDSNYRWMGSAAMDQSGDIGMGYSVSSSTVSPQIHWTGRLAADAAGTMTQGEGTLINGGGSQSGQSLSRWGDYSMMGVDPSDDCTFWFTTEYIATTGAFNWHTRVGSFKFPNCGGTTTTNDFSIGASPNSLTLNQGASGTSTISTAVTSGSAQSVALSVSGVPSGASASFSPTSVTAGGSSTLTVNAGSAAAGSYTLTITGTGASATHTTSVALTISGGTTTNDFSISASPSSLSIAQGSAGSSSISTAVTSGSAQTVSFSVSGVPSGASASFSPTSVTAGGTATLSISTGSAAAGNYTLTVTGTGASATHSTTVALSITAVVANDFSMSASPSSLSVTQGGSASSTISTAVTSGSAQTISLSVSGVPSGASASFSATSITAGSSSTLTVSSGSAAAGSYTLTVSGKGTSATHTATIALTINGTTTGGIVNGGFETGSLSGWTASGSTAAVTGGHGGTYAARVGSTSAYNGDSSVAQTFSAPSAGGTLSFFYKVVCTDTVTYDWATATLKDNTAGTTVTMLAKTCTNSGAWASASAALTGGHSYTLTLADHDDGYAGDPTYTLYDDVAISSGGTTGGGITNGGFETGTLSGWTRSGSASITSTPHTGSYSALVGNTVPTSGDSTVSQTFTAPSGVSQISLYYATYCPDTVTYDWSYVTLKDNTTGTTTSTSKACPSSYAWTNVTGTVTPGHSYTITIVNHDDNYAGDATYTLVDDVVLK